MMSFAAGASRRRRKFSVVVMSGARPVGWEARAASWRA